LPKEVFSSELGNIKLYTLTELRDMLHMPEAELISKLSDGTLKAKKIKDSWHVPDKVIEERTRLSARLAAAGDRARKSGSIRNTIAASSAAAVILVAAIAAYNIFGPQPVIATGCDAAGLDRMVLKSISASPLMVEMDEVIKTTCSEQALSGDADAYTRCSLYVKNPGSGLLEIGELKDISAITESQAGLSCEATLDAVASFSIEYSVTVSDGIARTVSVSLR